MVIADADHDIMGHPELKQAFKCIAAHPGARREETRRKVAPDVSETTIWRARLTSPPTRDAGERSLPVQEWIVSLPSGHHDQPPSSLLYAPRCVSRCAQAGETADPRVSSVTKAAPS
jgi:hypothetical protein